MYDGILRLNLPANAEIIGFADDIAIVLVAKTIPQIEALCNQVVDMVENWLNEARLAMAPQKTEAVLISSRKVVEYCTIKVGDCISVSTAYQLSWYNYRPKAHLQRALNIYLRKSIPSSIIVSSYNGE